MQQPLQITVKDIENTPAIEEQIQKKVEKLSQFSNDIISCHVVVELSQKNQNVGKLHDVHITLTVPGKELVSNRNPNENLWIAIRDAFDSMRDQLQSHMQQVRREIKTHAEIEHGKIARIIDDFGFILSSDGITEYYFNSANVASPKFDKLTIGTPVHFIPVVGDEGPQAKRVTAKHHEEQ